MAVTATIDTVYHTIYHTKEGVENKMTIKKMTMSREEIRRLNKNSEEMINYSKIAAGFPIRKIGEEQCFPNNAEQVILYNINQVLKNVSFSNPEELKKFILDPKMVGEVTLHRLYKGEKEFFMGLSYMPLLSRNSRETCIEGLILDRMGIAFIEGIESCIDGFKGLQFIRKNITYAGLSKEKKGMNYECSTPEKDSNMYEGIITNFGCGEFKLYPNDDSKFLIHNNLNDYYNMFIKIKSLGSKHLLGPLEPPEPLGPLGP
jgi:hypothetical protein